jgi:2-polyprenyl-6-methoxyphenol hydroxylase-like FAD-dependent oxidoreductase
MFDRPDPEVLVVGAGPVGLVAARFLQQSGVRAEIVDLHQRTTQHSYALALHPRTLRVLDEAGLGETLASAGRKLTMVAFYHGGERCAEIDYSVLPVSHPHLLVVRQSVLERAVEDALRKDGGRVRWGHRLQSLALDAPRPRVEIATLDQVATGYPVARHDWVVVRRESMQPAYVIGADGYDSAVRRMAGIEMTERGGGDVFSIFEIEATGELPAEGRIILDPHLTSVYWPLEEGRCRWGFQIRDAADHEASVARLEQLIAARAPWWTARPTEIYWSTLAVFAWRLARSFGTGGVWLAGDAAHQAAPVGVHSMNAGVLEARELARRISRILRGLEAPSALDELGAEMHETWQRLVDAPQPGGRLVRVLPWASPWVRQSAARIVAAIPASGEDLEPLLNQIGLAVAPALDSRGAR